MGQWLLGIEADFEYFRSAGSNSVTGPFGQGFTGTMATSFSTDWLFTLRPRLGVILNNWLLYATGGLAVTNLKASWNFFTAPASVTESVSASETKAGWTVGGGFETMLPGRYTVGVEYLYVKFDNLNVASVAFEPGLPLTNPLSHSADLAANIVRLRLNKLF